MYQVMEKGAPSPRELISAMQKSIENFTHNAKLFDDLTLLTFKVS
jgi:hypothetical protein